MHLKCPPSHKTRPTKDRIREAVFDILNHHFRIFSTPITVLDAFAGSGALGLEALSQGAQFAYFIENDTAVFKILKENVEKLCDTHESLIIKENVMKLKQSPPPVDLIFCDPPYGKYEITEVSHALKNCFHDETLLVWESEKEDIPLQMCGFTQQDKRIYGGSAVTFWNKERDTIK